MCGRPGKRHDLHDAKRGDQLVTLMVDLPADDAELAEFVGRWSGASGNPRAAMGV